MRSWCHDAVALVLLWHNTYWCQHLLSFGDTRKDSMLYYDANMKCLNAWLSNIVVLECYVMYHVMMLQFPNVVSFWHHIFRRAQGRNIVISQPHRNSVSDHGSFVSIIANCLRRVTTQKSWYLREEDHDPCRGSWSWQRMMIPAKDDDPGGGWWSWQTIMTLAEQHDSVGKRRTTVQGPPWDRLGTIFGQIRKLISTRLGLVGNRFCMVEVHIIVGSRTK